MGLEGADSAPFFQRLLALLKTTIFYVLWVFPVHLHDALHTFVQLLHL